MDEICWEIVLRDTGTEQSWQYSKDTILRAQELTMLQHKKLSKGNKKLAWLSKVLLIRLRFKEKKVEAGVCGLDRMLSEHAELGSGKSRLRWN